MSPDISIVSLALFLTLLLPVFFLNRSLKLKFNKELIISILRMILQLAFVGVYLQVIFNLNNPVINMLYIVVMIIIASGHSIKSSSLRLKPLFLPILISVSIPQITVLLFFSFLVSGLDGLFEARMIIPVGGMLLGNCLNGNIIALNSFYEGIKDDEKRYNYTLMLGASHSQALLPYLGKSINRAMSQNLASMATIGLVSLPGMMTGQILAGSLPIEAIKYQIAIMISIFSAKYFSILLSLVISRKRGFNKYHLLNREIFLNK